MFISYSWLRELTNTALTPVELRERLTMVGLAIDAVGEVNGDFVLDVEVPSNRPDCLSHVGIAREVAVIETGSVKRQSGKRAPVAGRAEDITSVEIQDTDLCPRYAARVIRGVKIGASPDWLVKRLEEIGQRAINNVADITNYVLHELGQPLHAFDFAKLGGKRIVVRRAKKGEKLKTLDGVERELDTEMLVIADAEKPVALGGIMGGEESEISNSTVDVLIESAYFDPDSVRRTARSLGMDTEASRRFERGADCENVVEAQTRCVDLICEIAGGRATEDVIDIYPHPVTPKHVRFRPSRVESLTSLHVGTDQAKRILSGLGFVENQSSADAIEYTVPTWRVDVALEEDLVEEVARHFGYDKIASDLPPTTLVGEYQPSEMKRRALRRALAANGFDEAINISFIQAGSEEPFDLIPEFKSSDSEHFVTLQNPIIEEAGRMRLTLLPGLLESVRHNLNHSVRDVRLFEIGRIFATSPDGELPNERESLSMIATGGATEEGTARTVRDLDFYDFKGALEAGIDAMKLAPVLFNPGEVGHLEVGQSARIALVDGTIVGSIGRLRESLAATYKIRQQVYMAELDLSALLGAEERAVHYTPLPRYPSVVRDVTLLLDRKVTLEQIREAIRSENLPDFRNTRLVGTYEGANIAVDKRAVTVRIEYRSDERTLRDEEVEERHRGLVQSLLEKFDAEQR